MSANALEKGGIDRKFVRLPLCVFFTKTSGNSLQEIAGSIFYKQKIDPNTNEGSFAMLGDHGHVFLRTSTRAWPSCMATGP